MQRESLTGMKLTGKKKNLLNSLEGLTCDGGSDLLALFV